MPDLVCPKCGSGNVAKYPRMWKNDSGHGVHSKAHCLDCDHWWQYGTTRIEVLLPFDEAPEEQVLRNEKAGQAVRAA